ncbi:nickel-dependent hydrogenase large subunit [Azospirillum soli]|uniref:nickel-dependent hydrogenase large subunit n=1 Tax=Azospirillum soli TaxID=1304799 RepID=UPI001AE11F86|nr:nickel-dependent hydrogenase large subunit [Azospirillum soli]MBP2315961.1 coenzyme F420-reducing hydrogenase alpha subunit [Azospirillum soli]
MTTAGGLEGSISVRLSVADGQVRAADVRVRRPNAARALVGRMPDEAVRLVPLLFSLCGTAQALAATEALEEALGINAAPHAAARALLVLAETTESHAWQALIEWPKRLGKEPQPRALAVLRAATAGIPKALYPARDGLRPGGGVLRPDRDALERAAIRVRDQVEQVVFGGAVPTGVEALSAWAAVEATPAARLMRRALEPGFAGFGACGVAALAPHPARWFGERLAAAPGFSDRPDQNGAPAHTGPLARHTAHPLVAALLNRHGSGIAAHVAARLVELAELPARMAALVASLTPADPVSGSGGTGLGSGAVDTARGRLAHWVRLEAGRITDYRMVAPTEWNFAADGPLARGLTGATADDGLRERAGLLMTALDPCVACTIAIEQEDPAHA